MPLNRCHTFASGHHFVALVRDTRGDAGTQLTHKLASCAFFHVDPGDCMKALALSLCSLLVGNVIGYVLLDHEKSLPVPEQNALAGPIPGASTQSRIHIDDEAGAPKADALQRPSRQTPTQREAPERVIAIVPKRGR